MNAEHSIEIANLIAMWVSLTNVPLLLLIVRMLWGFNNRLTILEVQARQDGDASPYRRRYRRAKTENEQ